jgi:hypothetical protein
MERRRGDDFYKVKLIDFINFNKENQVSYKGVMFGSFKTNFRTNIDIDIGMLIVTMWSGKPTNCYEELDKYVLIVNAHAINHIWFTDAQYQYIQNLSSQLLPFKLVRI